MKRITCAILLLLLTTGILVVSCKKQVPTWDTNILAPIINVSMSVNDLVTGTSVKSNPADSSVTVVFSDSLYTMNMDSLFRIPDTTLLNSLKLPFPITYTITPGAQIYPPTTTTTNYGVSSVQLKQAIIKSGFVKFEAISRVKGITDFNYTVPGATLYGNPLNITIKVPAATSTSTGDTTRIYPLDNYVIDFTGPSHNSYNLLSTIVSGILDPSASTTIVTQSDSITIKATFYSIVPYYGQGYFGKSTRSMGPSNSPFSLFRKFISGTLNLQDITVSLTLENGFGVDARVNISQLTSTNANTGGIVNLNDNSVINNAININAATQTYNPNSPVNPSILTFNITPSNSNILTWIDNLPTTVAYALQVTTDPLGNVSGSNDFAFNGYGIKSYLNINVPLSLVANNLTLADTTAINFGNSANVEQIKSGTFTLYATNGFPFSAGMQIYLLDNNAHIVDSLLTPPQTITAGITNINGIVIKPTNSTLVIALDTYHTQLLFNTKHIIIMSRFNMSCPTCTPPPYSKIYDYNKLSIKLVGNFDYQVKG